jgi:hypothetical protein
LLIKPGIYTDIAGVVLGGAILAYQLSTRRNETAAAAKPASEPASEPANEPAQ